MDGQKRLKNARVLCGCRRPGQSRTDVPGSGGCGHLGHRRVRRRGRVEPAAADHHGQSTVGLSKAESARARIAEINPFVNVALHDTRLDSSNVMEIFAQYDLIVDGTDNFATRYLVNDACVLLGKPYVWGSIFRFEVRPVSSGPSTVRATGACTGTAAARHGAVVRRRGPGSAVRLHRFDPGHRGDQGADRHRRSVGRPVDDLRRLEMTYRSVKVRKDPTAPCVATTPRSPNSSTTTCSAGGVRRGVGGGEGFHDLGAPTEGHARRAGTRRTGLPCSSMCVSRTSGTS